MALAQPRRLKAVSAGVDMQLTGQLHCRPGTTSKRGVPPRSGEETMKRSRIALASLLTASLGASAPAAAAEPVTLALNWVPGADHAPYYYAKKLGWYAAENLDVSIEAGRGSAASAQKVGAGSAQLGVADLPVVLSARGKGAELVAVMDIYANSAQGFYWL